MRKLIALCVVASFFVSAPAAWAQDDGPKKEDGPNNEAQSEAERQAAIQIAAAQKNYLERFVRFQELNDILPRDTMKSLKHWAFLADKTVIWTAEEIEELDRTGVLFEIALKYGHRTAEIFGGSEGGGSDGWQTEGEAMRAFTNPTYLARLDRYIETLRQLMEAVKQSMEKLSAKLTESPRIAAWEKEAEQKAEESMKITDADPNQKPNDTDGESGDESKKEEGK